MYEENMKSTISPTVKRAYRLIKMIQEIKCSPRQAVAQLIDNLGISKAQFYKDRKALADLGFEFHYSRPVDRFVVTKDVFLPVEDLSLSERLVREDYDFAKRHKNAFSAFPGEQTEKVAVRFSPKVRPHIEESLWHHSQVITRENDGTIRFEVDVAEPREVMWWAFQWGAEAEILELVTKNSFRT